MSEGNPGDKKTSVALIGMMGVGKSTVGALLASRLDCAWADLDRLVSDEDREGRHCSEILRDVGEAAFRDLEHHALCAWLESNPGFALISLGGGALLHREIRAMLSSADFWVGWLSAAPMTLARRLGETSVDLRPLLGNSPSGEELAARLSSLCAQREAHYRAIADFCVDTTDHTAKEVVELLLAQLVPNSGGLLPSGGAS